jgi:hypothetical protein
MLPLDMMFTPRRQEHPYASGYVIVYDAYERDDDDQFAESISVVHIQRPTLLFSGPIRLLPARRPFIPWSGE